MHPRRNTHNMSLLMKKFKQIMYIFYLSTSRRHELLKPSTAENTSPVLNKLERCKGE